MGHSVLLGPETILVRGLVKLVPALTYHFCLNLPATFSQPRTSIISGPSSSMRFERALERVFAPGKQGNQIVTPSTSTLESRHDDWSVAE